MKSATWMIVAATLVAFWNEAAPAGSPIAGLHRVHSHRGACWYNTNRSWHQNYQHVQYGRPLALIVPPTAQFQTEYAWGVGRTQMLPLHHQFGRPIASPGAGGVGQAPPPWPWSTQQLGVYSVRGAW